MKKVWTWLKTTIPGMWKAIMPLVVGLIFAVALYFVEALQGTFVDSPMMMAILTSIAVYLKANKPAA